MLTVLWRQKNGEERLFEAKSISRIQPKDVECVPAHGPFNVVGPDDIPFQFDIERPFGAVFVMNENGTTVARYMAEPLIGS